MSEQNPYDQLGVTEDSSFDEIQEARNHLVEQYSDDRKQQEAIEEAYDSILMDRLRMRQEGKIKVPERIRFPEKLVQPPPNFTPTPPSQAPNWLQRLVDTPSGADILWPAGIYTALGGLSAFYPSPDGTILQVTLALGIGAALYFLNRKERKFGRALLLTLAALILGLIVGGVLSGFSHTLLIGLGLTDETFTTLITLVIMWLVSSFLR